ncbi:hypothetical protein DY000_02061938 [Brassica cretica]|uniref:Uncharacterized protein n=1 Tax=Brassica cretica TaxID=69181 RepID=A0ABQ7AQ64_BRACR|nr:hypothetical protein DY000_02061938 [Brassica cretica]
MVDQVKIKPNSHSKLSAIRSIFVHQIEAECVLERKKVPEEAGTASRSRAPRRYTAAETKELSRKVHNLMRAKKIKAIHIPLKEAAVNKT